MKTKYVMLFLLSAVTVPTIAQDEPTPANCPLAQVIVVDGIADEWPMKWLADDDKEINYNVCSDESNLYIRFKTSDNIYKRKIAFFGFTVWMDANGKKKKKLGFKFPTGSEGKERMESMREGANPQKMTAPEREAYQKRMEKYLISDLELIELIGLSDDPLTSTRSGITNGIKVAIAATDSGAYVYEAVIPFKSYRLSKAAIETLGIGFETGKYVPPPSKTPAGGNNPGASSGFGGAGRGYGGQGGYGGRAGMRGGGGGQQRTSEMSLNSGVWVTVKLK